MRDMTTLEEVGLQEVSRKTHIEVKTLQYMVNKEFDKLSRINTLGFLKILSREFHLDLSGWQEEFEEYWKSTKGQEETKEPTFVLSSSKRSSKPMWLLILLLGGLGAGVWYFDAWGKIQTYLENQNTAKEAPIAFTVAPIVEETKESLELVQQVPAEALEENNQTQTLLVSPQGSEETSLHVNTVQEESAPEVAVQENLAQESNTQEPVQASSAQSATVNAKEGIILPNVNIWVGVVYLDTKKRASHLSQDPITLDFSREQIITTGHGNFTFINGEERHEYTAQLPKRFHVKDGTLREITQQEFVALNGGSNW